MGTQEKATELATAVGDLIRRPDAHVHEWSQWHCEFSGKNMLTQGIRRSNKVLMTPYKVQTAGILVMPATPMVAVGRCPLCDSSINRKQFIEIQSRIREQEQRKLEEQRRSLQEHQRKLDEQYRVKIEVLHTEEEPHATSDLCANRRSLRITAPPSPGL